jgi:hypothetical protein
MLFLTEHRPLPGVVSLRDEIEAVYMRNKRGKTQEDVPNMLGMVGGSENYLGLLR